MAISPERHKKIFGADFIYPEKKRVWQLRSNSIKIAADELEKRLKEKCKAVEKVSWHDAFVVESEENLSKYLEHSLGYFFLQNLSSMVPPLVLEPNETDTVLDLAAAPGAKTTQIAAIMQNKGAIIANDITYDRLKALRGNLQRCGVANTLVTNMDGKFFYQSEIKADKILLDAPCTGTGTLSPRILKTTSEHSIRKLSNIQKHMLSSAASCLDRDGVLVYSTCSLEPEENEENVDYAVRQLGLAVEDIEMKGVKTVDGITEWEGKQFDGSVSNSIRIVPDGVFEGFFVCKLRKY